MEMKKEQNQARVAKDKEEEPTQGAKAKEAKKEGIEQTLHTDSLSSSLTLLGNARR
jgi:hypothetical protein